MSEMRRIHDCIHSVGTHVERVDSKVEDLAVSLHDTRETVSFIQGVQSSISQRLGVPGAISCAIPGEQGPPPPVRPAFFLAVGNRWKVVATGIGCIAGVITLYQLLAMALPGMLSALHHALMAAK